MKSPPDTSCSYHHSSIRELVGNAIIRSIRAGQQCLWRASVTPSRGRQSTALCDADDHAASKLRLKQWRVQRRVVVVVVYALTYILSSYHNQAE